VNRLDWGAPRHDFVEGRDLLEAAFAYADHGWPVFPCRADKRPRTEHGFKDASSDPAVIEEWWRRWPAASIGIAAGAAGLVVIDIDVKNGAPGADSWQALVAAGGEGLDDTASARTPSGGRHLYYRAPEVEIASSAGRLAPGIDVRAAGGYVIAPPSVGPGTVAYEWLAGHGPERLRALPSALAGRLSEAQVLERPLAACDERILSGERNSTLASVAGGLRAQGLSQDVIEVALLRENATRCDPPLPDDDVRRIAASIARYAARPPTGVPRSRGSDTDNAERFITMFGERVRYCALEKSWYIYGSGRWARDERLMVAELMRQALLSVFGDAARARDDAEATNSGRAALRLQSAQARRAALECARSDPRVAVHPTEFDRHPWLLNCRNGTLDLRSGALRPHDPLDLIRQLAPVDYDPGARHETWERFLDEATGGDLDLREYLQRAAGYSLTGDTGERVFFLLLGPTTTGKSTFIDALSATLGDYAHAAGIEAFLRRTTVGGARPEIAALAGRRLVTGVEVDRRRSLDEVLVKQVVGGDAISERDLYVRAVPFIPECKLWFAANDAPQMSDMDDALWVRAREIPFTRRIPEERKNPAVKATLRDPDRAGAAILAWAVRGCQAWQEEGLGSAREVREATQALRLSMDPLADFLSECCWFEPDAYASNLDLRAAYRDWLAGWGAADSMSSKEWGLRLQARGLQRAKVGGARGYRGVCLREGEAPASELARESGTGRTAGQ